MEEQQLIEYFVVNNELNMSAGKVAAQVAHVATIIAMNEKNQTFSDWFYKDQRKIILRGKEKDLLKLIELGAYHIRDNGHTEVPPNSLTCVGFAPNTKEAMKPYIGRLRLY
ncbi:peptidyl-tRNA hydrolase [Paenibacillus sp. CCS19]|uniref:aminoacyl-tRNA hydrolase n=1 Tax=Paenibacillus sp. CCS19 TaxID=3158387 RepID=UPI002568ED85|nr:aminoacyl-tRNA hydrolase [Paenibacillus cellulosilyticus]GMK40561.1 peptidyl-tRNA hydrolase [Paenibacillus cellulosilyticus]